MILTFILMHEYNLQSKLTVPDHMAAADADADPFSGAHAHPPPFDLDR